MNCAAPGAPAGCSGDVSTAHAVGVCVPLCPGHAVAFADLSGPWRTRNGAEEWLACMRSQMGAELQLQGRVPLEDPSGAAGRPREKWVNWNNPEDVAEKKARGFEWHGGKGPLWDTSDFRERYKEDERELATTKETIGKPRKKPWYLRFKKKKNSNEEQTNE